MFKKIMIGVFGLTAILFAILIGFSSDDSKTKSDYNADAMTTCNSVIPQKYPALKVIKKYEMKRVKEEPSHYRWSWVIRNKNEKFSITCKVYDSGKYAVKRSI